MSSTTPKQMWVIAYDISDDKKRNKIARILEDHGVRCNYSVFECLLTETQKQKLQKKLQKFIDSGGDSLLFYYLCNACIQKREVIGHCPDPVPEVILI